MSLVDLPTAKAHVRDEEATDLQVTPYLNAAELSAVNFLNRKVYATQNELDMAIAAVPAALLTAGTTYEAAILAADAITDQVASAAAAQYATGVYALAQDDARATRSGMVVNDAVKAAILLIFGSLYENRQDVVAGVTVAQIPMGSQYLLQPYRVAMGV